MGGVRITSYFPDEALASQGSSREAIMSEFADNNADVIEMEAIGVVITVEEID
jgi:hypothetical protein